MPVIQGLAPGEPGAARRPPPARPCCGLRVLAGRPDQVRVARQLVRECLNWHPAAGDAVLVASELAANSVTHSASRLPAGRFLIRVTPLDGQLAAVTVTDQGGPFIPPAAGPDGVSGRGLAVIRSLACLFRITDHDALRTFTAVISAPGITAPAPYGAAGPPLTGHDADRHPNGGRSA